jgi:hypothetical protein
MKELSLFMNKLEYVVENKKKELIESGLGGSDEN